MIQNSLSYLIDPTPALSYTPSQAETRAQESKRRLDEARSQEARMTDNTEEAAGVGAREGDTVLEVSGRRITLTQEERENPEIASKFQ